MYRRLTTEDLAVIETCFTQKGWRGARICREFRGKEWAYRNVNKAIKRLETTASISPLKKSDRPKTATSNDTLNDVEDLVLSQDSQPGSHSSARVVAKRLGIGRSSVQRLVKKRLGLKSVKRLHNPTLPEGTKLRRFQRAGKLLSRFPTAKVKSMTFQDEKDFTLEVPSNPQNNRCYSKVKKSEIALDRLYHTVNKQSLKLMVSCCVSWNGVTKPFFLDPSKAKVTGKYYAKHVEKDLLPECTRLYPANDFIFAQDGASSHTSKVCQETLKRLCPKRFIEGNQWPPKSPDCNVLDYYFWDKLKREVYKGRKEPFADIERLKRRIKRVWNRSINMDEIHKALLQFRPRLRAVVDMEGGPIKHLYR